MCNPLHWRIGSDSCIATVSCLGRCTIHGRIWLVHDNTGTGFDLTLNVLILYVMEVVTES